MADDRSQSTEWPLEPGPLVDKIFEWDTKYQGNLVKAASRAEFLREYPVKLVRHAIEQAYQRGYQDHAAGR